MTGELRIKKVDIFPDNILSFYFGDSRICFTKRFEWSETCFNEFKSTKITNNKNLIIFILIFLRFIFFLSHSKGAPREKKTRKRLWAMKNYIRFWANDKTNKTDKISFMPSSRNISSVESAANIWFVVRMSSFIKIYWQLVKNNEIFLVRAYSGHKSELQNFLYVLRKRNPRHYTFWKVWLWIDGKTVLLRPWIWAIHTI